MEDYRLPAPLVGMLRASKLTGKPIVKTELLSTKLHVTLTWDLATSAPRRTKNHKSTKTAKPAPTTQQPAKSSPRRQPPAPTPAPAAPAPAPEPTVVHQPCPETLPPQVAAGRIGVQPMDQRSQLTPTPAAKRPAPSPDTSTEDDAAKIQRCASPKATATINLSPLKIIPGISTDDDDNAPPTLSEIDVRSKEIGQKYLSYTKYFYKEARRVKEGDNNEYYVNKANRKVAENSCHKLPTYFLRAFGEQEHGWTIFKDPASKYHHSKWWNFLDSYDSVKSGLFSKDKFELFTRRIKAACDEGRLDRAQPLEAT